MEDLPERRPAPATVTPALSQREFVPMMALLISLAAMAIDAVLPALGLIGADLRVANANDTQLVVSMVFAGLALGQLFIGPLSDAVGRKPAIYLALAIFALGSFVCMVADDFTVMLTGRMLQGLGAAGPRIVCVALVRDQYAGRSMARIMSTVLAVFILVPALAPGIGQVILLALPWRAIYALLLLQTVIATVWFAVRQPETLSPRHRLQFSLGRIASAALETVSERTSSGYTISAGLILGALLGYLSSAQQVFQGLYGVGSRFAVYFATLALSLGAASVVNARIVERFGMRHLCFRALLLMSIASCAFSAVAYAQNGTPPLWQLMTFLIIAFFCMGLLFGNFNALAMEPLGHIAGTAAAVIGSISTLISLACGVAIGRALDGTVLPLVTGFAGLAVLALLVMLVTEKRRAQGNQATVGTAAEQPVIK